MNYLSERVTLTQKREFRRVVGAWLFGIFFYYAILIIIYFVHEIYFINPDLLRALALEKHSLMVALEAYRKEHNAYPLLPDNPIGDVKKQLVRGGYLPPAPDADKDARYVSLDGKSYGLKFHAPHPCLVEVDIAGTKWWGAPICRF